MDFELSADQKLLLDTVASFVKRESPVSRLRSLRADPLGWQRPTWKQMGDLGWLAIALPEEAGGLGGSFVDASLVLEQLGTTLVPEPYVPTLLAAIAIGRRGDDAQRERFLAPALAGDTSLAFAWAEQGSRFSADDPKVVATANGDGFSLSGTKVFVDNGHAADHLVVTARDGAHVSLFVVDPKAPGVTVEAFPTIDGHRAARIRCDAVKLTKDARLGEGDASALVTELLDLGAAAACAEAVGIMRTVLAMTCDYLRTREQFGVKIGSFQALAHRAVDMFVETELSRGVTMIASMKVASEPSDRMAAVSAAKAQVFESGRFVTQQAIQLHGGIGVTDEHDIGLYFKRMHVLLTAYGDEEHHVSRFASLPTFALHSEAIPGGRNDDLGEAFFLELPLQHALRGLVAVHEGDVRQIAGAPRRAGELEQVVLIAVRRETGQHVHTRPQVALDAEDLHPRAPFDDAPTERVLCLEADDHHGILRVFDGGLQVVKHAPRLAHAAGREHDRRPRRGIDGLRLFLVGHVRQRREVER